MCVCVRAQIGVCVPDDKLCFSLNNTNRNTFRFLSLSLCLSLSLFRSCSACCPTQLLGLDAPTAAPTASQEKSGHSAASRWFSSRTADQAEKKKKLAKEAAAALGQEEEEKRVGASDRRRSQPGGQERERASFGGCFRTPRARNPDSGAHGTLRKGSRQPARGIATLEELAMRKSKDDLHATY